MTESNSNKSEEERNEVLTNSLITREELEKFKEIAFAEYGIRLTDQQAFEQATALLTLFDTLLQQTLEIRKKRVNMDTNIIATSSCK